MSDITAFGNVSGLTNSSSKRSWFHRKPRNNNSSKQLAEIRQLSSQFKMMMNRQSLFVQLPPEIQILIFSKLEPEDLASASMVCKDFYLICNDSHLWHRLVEEKKGDWEASGCGRELLGLPESSEDFEDLWVNFIQDIHDLFLEKLDEKEYKAEMELRRNFRLARQQEINWKKVYIEQHLLNKKQPVKKKRTFQKALIISNPFSRFKNFLDNEPFRIPMFGDGLDTSAKKLLYKMMWDESFPYIVAALYPGVEGFGSGVGFEVNKTLLNIAALYHPQSYNQAPPSSSSISQLIKTPVWSDYFKSAHGFIYVMPNLQDQDTLSRCKEEIQLFLEDSHDRPLLIFACQVEGRENETLSSFELAKALGWDISMRTSLSSTSIYSSHNRFTSPWCVRCILPSDLSSVADGLEWLAYTLNPH